VKKASEYRQHAEECRMLAANAKPEHRDMLIKMAETWDTLAANREAQLARQERIEAIVAPIGKE
jgi:hypothetical protein